jgi:hypothetical protein
VPNVPRALPAEAGHPNGFETVLHAPRGDGRLALYGVSPAAW